MPVPDGNNDPPAGDGSKKRHTSRRHRAHAGPRGRRVGPAREIGHPQARDLLETRDHAGAWLSVAAPEIEETRHAQAIAEPRQHHFVVLVEERETRCRDRAGIGEAVALNGEEGKPHAERPEEDAGGQTARHHHPLGREDAPRRFDPDCGRFAHESTDTNAEEDPPTPSAKTVGQRLRKAPAIPVEIPGVKDRPSPFQAHRRGKIRRGRSSSVPPQRPDPTTFDEGREGRIFEEAIELLGAQANEGVKTLHPTRVRPQRPEEGRRE